MAAPLVTVVGRLTADPELRFTPSGAAVVTLNIASNDSFKKGDEWEQKPTVFLRATAWREFAENVADSLQKGAEVIAVGRLSQNDYEDREGNKRTSIQLELEAVGPSLKFATAKVTKASKNETASAGAPGGW